ncbi:MAG TPA: aldo/keto reductase [Candidatus Peribacteria bacterium]|nr:aldo/keto reductase [Candidatus Peribacteria bacterium]
MEYTTLSTTDLRVSKICLGTMSYAAQVSESDAFVQMEYALGNGVNFWDTAEMYPIPVNPDLIGDTERIIGRWFKKTGKRKDVVLATKIAGPSRFSYLRDGDQKLDRRNIARAIDDSLIKLQTDWIDLYQLHWPDRNVPMFGQRGYTHDPADKPTPIEETLSALGEAVKAGKIRHVGLSNETPWGVMEFLRIAKEKGYPRMVSIQNAYNLLNRHFETGLSEISHRENIGLLPYSPLGYGILGGRYFDGSFPQGGRFTLHPEFAVRYRTPQAEQAAKAYADLAKKHGLSLPTMALAFVNSRPFVTSNIIGASLLAQLKEDIASLNVTLSPDVLNGIEQIHEQWPNVVA